MTAFSKRRFALISFFVLAALAAGCSKQGGDAAAKQGAGGPPQAMPVTAVRVSMQKVPISIEAVGQAEGSRQVEIRSRVSGILEKRLYDEGAAVPANAPLFLVDPVPYELAVQEAKAALAQATAARDVAEADAKRLGPLVQEKAVSQRDYDQAIGNAKTATAAIASAEAKLKQAEIDLSYTRVNAPISGVTGRALRSEGSLVTANTDTALLTTLSQVNPIWVRFPLAQSDFNRVRAGEGKTQVQLVGEDGKVLADNGHLNFASTTVDAKTGAVDLRAEFPNPGTKWLPGQFMRVRVLAGEQTAMRVPQNAVLQTDQARVVMTVGPDNKVTPKPVTTANWVGSDIIVTAGLQEGDQVIVDNLVKLRPGAPVAPHAPGEGPAGAAPAKAASAK
jgi:membrane fusion protein, multidrug efflux system